MITGRPLIDTAAQISDSPPCSDSPFLQVLLTSPNLSRKKTQRLRMDRSLWKGPGAVSAAAGALFMCYRLPAHLCPQLQITCLNYSDVF
jgi:hypothetical protein